MREIRPSGLAGGGPQPNAVFLPDPHQYFIRNGVQLSLYFQAADAAAKPTKTSVNMNASAVLFEPVFPEDAKASRSVLSRRQLCLKQL